MVKKISAVLLALVLCFSVVVLPASATGFPADYTLADGMNVAYKLEWDKASYNPGDTAYLKVYMRVADGYELSTGNIAIGFNSSVITQADNPVATLKANAVASEAWTGYWKAPDACTTSWLANTIVSRIQTANTAEENALYDQYMKVVIGRDTATGTGEFATDNTHGAPAADINALGEEPVITYAYKVSASVANGTELKAAITSGTLSATPAQTSFKYMTAPGSTNKTANVTGFDVSEAVATATVGTPAPAGPALSHVRRELKMDVQDGAVVKGSEQLRVVSAISQADWNAYFANTTTERATANAIQEVGIVAYQGQVAAFNADTAKAVAQGTPADGYTAAKTDYIQNDTAASGNYLFGARIKYQSAAFDTTYLAYVKYLDAAGQVAYAFYDTTTIYSLNFAQDYATLTQSYIDWLATQG